MSGHGGHETHDDGDTFGKWIGVATALLGLCVVVSTIIGHKAHTNSLTHKADASDTWNYFQAKKIRAYESGIAADQYDIMTAKDPEKAQKKADALREKQAKSEKEAEELKAKAEGFEHASHVEHVKGDWMDLSEGLFELGVILCSLYFLSKKKLFPSMGFTAAAFAAVIFGWAFVEPLTASPHGEGHAPAAQPEAHAAPADAHLAH